MPSWPTDDAGTRQRWQAVGAEVRAARLEREMSQADLAERIGVRQNVVSEDERGKERGIPIHRLVAYAQALNMDYELLAQMAYGLNPPRPGESFRRRTG